VNARPVLGSLDEVREWASICESQGLSLPAALHVDTGMNRLGLPMDELPAVASAFGAVFRPSLLISHFACADAPAHALTGRQIARFAQARSILSDIPSSLANSPGIFLAERPHYDMVRPGYALYGGNPTPGRPNPMRPVVGLDARIIQVRDVAAGDTVGYGATWSASTPRRIATVSVGYADGFLRAGGAANVDVERGRDRGAAIVAGRLCPLVGRVSMDLVTIDISDVPVNEAKRGDAATLIGGALDIDEVARRAGTIGYEILTSLGRRYSRRYLS
jgi:alanine racemase